MPVLQQDLQNVHPLRLGDGLPDQGFDLKHEKGVPLLPDLRKTLQFRHGQLRFRLSRFGKRLHLQCNIDLDRRFLHPNRTRPEGLKPTIHEAAFLRCKEKGQKGLDLLNGRP